MCVGGGWGGKEGGGSERVEGHVCSTQRDCVSKIGEQEKERERYPKKKGITE